MVRHDGGGGSRCRRMRSAISSSLGSALFLLEEAAEDGQHPVHEDVAELSLGQRRRADDQR